MIRKLFTTAVCLLCLQLLAGCFFRSPVRHLASDVCLLTQGTTREEVLTYMGPPDDQQVDQYGEMWIYYQVNKTLLRKTPYIGEKLGNEDVDVVTIRFAGEKVTTCAYRSLTPEEFKKSGISRNDELPAE
ncbi:MAG: hypothetical protein BM485_03965 [Desulfobulbaceae bacterium DB1]|nr:MAG: hypothetical protein BM485_03965 [Desulfobulbaceae bacterium DB1]